MKMSDANHYPYLQVIILFAGLGSIIGGLIVELLLLLIFNTADFSKISYQPILYVGLLAFIPTLFTGIIVAKKQIKQGDKGGIGQIFLIGFLTSALYIAAIVIYLGISTLAEIGLLLAFMLVVGIFGALNSVIASVFALPKACKTSFDNVSKKAHDIYQGVH